MADAVREMGFPESPDKNLDVSNESVKSSIINVGYNLDDLMESLSNPTISENPFFSGIRKEVKDIQDRMKEKFGSSD